MMRRVVKPAGRLAVLLSLAVALVATACDRPAGEDRQSAAMAKTAGKERLLALAPSLVELVFALGAGDQLVGVGDYARFPPEVSELPRLGGLIDPHLEEIVALAPDLAILLPSEETVRQHLEALGVEVLVVRNETLDDVSTGARTLGARLGVAARGIALAQAWEADLAAQSIGSSPTVLVTVGRPLGELGSFWVAGATTFLGELVSRLGALNMLDGSGLAYPQIGLEAVLERLPEVILELHSEEPTAAARDAAIDEWAPYARVPAVRDGCVFVLGGDYMLVPGPRLSQLYGELAMALRSCASRSS